MWIVRIVFVFCLFGSAFPQFTKNDLKAAYDSFVAEHVEPELAKLEDVVRKLENGLLELKVRKHQILADKFAMSLKVAKLPQDCRQDDFLQSHATVLKSWSWDSCVNLTDQFVKGEDVVVEGWNLIYNVTVNIGKIGNALLDCPGFNPVTTVNCFIDNIRAIKELIVTFVANNSIFFQHVKLLLLETRIQFDECVGIPINATAVLSEYMPIANNNCK